jgi:hypothetical protein
MRYLFAEGMRRVGLSNHIGQDTAASDQEVASRKLGI